MSCAIPTKIFVEMSTKAERKIVDVRERRRIRNRG